MRYRGSLLIEAGVTRDDPAVATIELCHGLITEAEILFPAGQAGLTYVQLYYQERQIFPTTPREAFRGDDHVIEFPDRYEIFEAPLEVEVRGWAPEANLDHRVYVSLSVEPSVLRALREAGRVPLPEGM